MKSVINRENLGCNVGISSSQVENSETSETSDFNPILKIKNFEKQNLGKKIPRFLRFPTFPSF